MPPLNPKSTSSNGFNLGLFAIPQSIVLQVGTTSLMLALVAQKAAFEAMESIGQASEEIFRGERLPILDFPESKSQKSS
jgi:hypothetical protein